MLGGPVEWGGDAFVILWDAHAISEWPVSPLPSWQHLHWKGVFMVLTWLPAYPNSTTQERSRGDFSVRRKGACTASWTMRGCFPQSNTMRTSGAETHPCTHLYTLCLLSLQLCKTFSPVSSALLAKTVRAWGKADLIPMLIPCSFGRGSRLPQVLPAFLSDASHSLGKLTVVSTTHEKLNS